MLCNGVDIFALQKLMGHSDLQILRRYLAQTDQDIHTAHMRGSPVDSNLMRQAGICIRSSSKFNKKLPVQSHSFYEQNECDCKKQFAQIIKMGY